MPKVTKTGQKKENSVEKRKRRENNRQAREQARRFILPSLLLFLVLFIGFVFFRYGTGKSLDKEAIERRRQRNQFSKMMRESSSDFTKLKNLIKNEDAEGTSISADNADIAPPNEESEAIVTDQNDDNNVVAE